MQRNRSWIWEDIQSSTDSFDQSLLTLSSGALGLSLAFIKDIVPLKDAVWIALLFTSWIAFALCIVSTVASFLLSVKANKQQLGYIDEYYIHRNDLALDKHKSSRYVKWLERCTWVGIILFVAGLFCTIIFACENVARLRMNENKGKSPLRIDAVQGGRQPVDMTPVAPGRPAPVTPAPTPQEQRGRQPMNMTPVVSAPLEKGRQPVSMTRVPLKEGRQPVKITPVKPASPSLRKIKPAAHATILRLCQSSKSSNNSAQSRTRPPRRSHQGSNRSIRGRSRETKWRAQEDHVSSGP